MADETTHANAPGDDERPALTFAAFVLSLAHTAAVHFGDVPDPVTGKPAEASLPAAQQMIDILCVLEAKTQGNLDQAEQGLVESMLYDLRMRYVELMRRGAKEAT